MPQHLSIAHITTKEIARLFSKVQISASRFYNGSPCWEWQSALRHGYASVSWQGKAQYGHRVFYAWLVGTLTQGKDKGEIDHLCRNTICVNPAHLELVDTATNVLRSECPGAINARKTHCKKGHALETKKRQRSCRICAAEKYHERKANDPEWLERRRQRSRERQAQRKATDAEYATRVKASKRKSYHRLREDLEWAERYRAYHRKYYAEHKKD